jgi:AraC family transcriptional regulator of adaptative response/methylated-DNA-[protein]-cysteine methyltransferase
MTLQGLIKPKSIRGAGLEIRYGQVEYDGLPLLVGITDGKICYAGFTDQAAAIRYHYPQSRLVRDQTGIAAFMPPVLHSWKTKAALDRNIEFYAEATAFGLDVWRYLLTIEPGQTVSYKEIATALGRPKAFRAVGNAVGVNPVTLFIPCHRVLHSSGGKTGYAWGADIKTRLLAAEEKFHKKKAA